MYVCKFQAVITSCVIVNRMIGRVLCKLFLSVDMCVCIYVYIYVYMYIHVCTCVYIYARKFQTHSIVCVIVNQMIRRMLCKVMGGEDP